MLGPFPSVQPCPRVLRDCRRSDLEGPPADRRLRIAGWAIPRPPTAPLPTKAAPFRFAPPVGRPDTTCATLRCLPPDFPNQPRFSEGTIMKILVINNDGGGFADYVEIAEGTTVQELFRQHVRKRQARRLPDPRQPPARARGPGAGGRRPHQLHAHQDRRRTDDRRQLIGPFPERAGRHAKPECRPARGSPWFRFPQPEMPDEHQTTADAARGAGDSRGNRLPHHAGPVLDPAGARLERLQSAGPPDRQGEMEGLGGRPEKARTATYTQRRGVHR